MKTRERLHALISIHTRREGRREGEIDEEEE